VCVSVSLCVNVVRGVDVCVCAVELLLSVSVECWMCV